MRKWILVIVLILSILLLLTNLKEIYAIVGVLQAGNLWYLGIAFLVDVIWFFVPGKTYQTLYRILGLKEKWFRLTLVAVGANFLNIVAPSVGISGMALFVDDGKSRGHPAGKVLAVGSISLFLDYLAFLCVLFLGVIVLFRRNRLDTTTILPSIIILLLTIFFAVILYLGSRSGERLADFMDKIANWINTLTKKIANRRLINLDRSQSFAFDLSDGLSSIQNKRRLLWIPFLLALINKGILILILVLVFLSFQVPFTAGTIIGGFSIGYLFMIISPTPAGVGFMEGAFILALNSLNVQWRVAVIIALTYRALTFWIPLGIGAIAFHCLNLKKNNKIHMEN